MGPRLRPFETEVRGTLGDLQVVGCASGTDALVLALLVFEIVCAAGDSGLVTTPVADVAQWLHALRAHGQTRRGTYAQPAYPRWARDDVLGDHT